jgi:RecB family exonuclease
MDLSPDGRALVIDYKYSPVEKQRSLLQDSESGHKVQAGVYMLAAERFFGHRVAGMLYCHLKKDVGWGGWHANIPGLEVGAKMTEDAVRSIARTTEETVLRVHAEIATGSVAVAPRDPKLCVWCESRDICRVESIERVKTATSQGGAQ